MDRILIVEKDKTLANAMAKKISDALEYEVDVAHTFNETKLFLRQYRYFLSILDLNLPDAPNGEVVDYVLGKNQKFIVLSENIDKGLKEKTLKKNIIDYVTKDGCDYTKYLIESIARLGKNKNHTILIVDDSMVMRKQLQALLANIRFKTIAVAHGEEALAILKTRDDVSLVLTDYNMPVMDGLELTQKIRERYDKKILPIIALSSDDDQSTIALFLKKGANDYIKKPFSKEEFSCRVHNGVETLEYIRLITEYEVRFDDL